MKKQKKPAKRAPARGKSRAAAGKTKLVKRPAKKAPRIADEDFANEYDQAYDPHKFGI